MGLRLVVSLACCAGLVLGCGGSDDDPDAFTDSDANSDIDAAMNDELVGMWQAPCEDFTVHDASFSGSDTTGYWQRNIYADMACTQAIGRAKIEFTRTVGPVQDYFSLDTTVTSYMFTILDQTYVTDWNNNQEGGYNDWQLNVPKDLSGKTNLPALVPETTNGDTWLGIYRINGSAQLEWDFDPLGLVRPGNFTSALQYTKQ